MKTKFLCTLMTATIALTASGCASTDPVSKKMIDDINSIGTVEANDEPLISKLESTYMTLTDSQKDQVSNYITLIEAREKVDKIIQNQKKLGKVERYAYKACLYIKNMCKDPSSFKLISLSGDTDHYSYKYVFEIEFSAKNGFGGVGTETVYVAIDDGDRCIYGAGSIGFGSNSSISITRIEAAFADPSLAR